MAHRSRVRKTLECEMAIARLETLPLWQLDIAEVTGHNLEVRGREEVNRLLQEGWRLLHIYTLKYEEDGVWRERPMAILGRLGSNREQAERGAAPLLSLVQK
jgi:FtsZ-binding cell division protein ZapB